MMKILITVILLMWNSISANIWTTMLSQRALAHKSYHGPILPETLSQLTWKIPLIPNIFACLTKTPWLIWDPTWLQTQKLAQDSTSCQRFMVDLGKCILDTWWLLILRTIDFKVSSQDRTYSLGCRCEQDYCRSLNYTNKCIQLKF